MTLIVEPAPYRLSDAAQELFTAISASWQPTAKGSIVALDAVDAFTALAARCAVAAGDRAEARNASVGELLSVRNDT